MATLGSRRGGERRTFRDEGEEEPERDEEEESKRVLQIEEELDPRIRSRKRGLSIYVHAEPHVGRRLRAHARARQSYLQKQISLLCNAFAAPFALLFARLL